MTTKKTQQQLFSELKVLAHDIEWNDIAAQLAIIPRTLKNYRMPDASSNYRKMDAATLRRVMTYVDGLIENDGIFSLAPVDEDILDSIDQKALFIEIKELAGNPGWTALADSLEFNHRTFETYRLPSDSVHYRKLPPLTFMEIIELRDRLLEMQANEIDPEERWQSIAHGAFEKVNMSKGIVRHIKKAQKAIDETKKAKKAKKPK